MCNLPKPNNDKKTETTLSADAEKKEKPTSDKKEEIDNERQKIEQQEIEKCEHKLKEDTVNALRPLWTDLSKHLEELEKLPDVQHGVLGLQDGMCQ